MSGWAQLPESPFPPDQWSPDPAAEWPIEHRPDVLPTRYIVIRPAPDLPAGFLPEHWDGRWFDRAQIPKWPLVVPTDSAPSRAAAVATGRFETREDGEIAEVYEVRP